MKTRFIIIVACQLSFLKLAGQVEQEAGSQIVLEDINWFSGFSITFEQDFLLEPLGLAALNSDQNYTQGLDIALFSEELGIRMNPRTFRNVSVTGIYQFDLPAKLSIKIAGFTPNDLRQEKPVVGDRPYSTLLSMSLELQRLDANTNQGKHVSKKQGLMIGILGLPNVADNIQSAIHNGMNDGNTREPYDPEGWHNQISHGGEPTLMISMERLRPFNVTNEEINKAIIEGDARATSKFIATYNYGFQAGYITAPYAGADLKVGRIRLRNWHSAQGNNLTNIAHATFRGNETSNNPDLPNISDPKDPELITNARNFYNEEINYLDWFFFANASTHLMLYNASLHGQFRETNYRLDYEDTGFLVGNLRAGFGLETSRTSFSIYWAFRSPEIWNSYARIHSWAGASLGFKW